jgi:hypothetical protein
LTNALQDVDKPERDRPAGKEVFRIPGGLVLADLQEAAKFIEWYDFDNESSEWSPDGDRDAEVRLAAKVYEFLAAAVARNQRRS